jgi:type II secretory pathway pseudopilin PulG
MKPFTNIIPLTSFAARDARRTVRGMTLMEVLIATTLLVFVIGSALSALSAGMGYMRHARMTTLANQITQSAMEQLRLANYATINSYAAQHQPVSFDDIITANNFASGFTSGMTVQVAFTTVTVSGPGSLGKTRLTITTNWSENGITFTRKTTSVFTEKGLSDYIYAGWSNL